MNKLIVCAFALTASVAVASPTVVDLTALARTAQTEPSVTFTFRRHRAFCCSCADMAGS